MPRLRNVRPAGGVRRSHVDEGYQFPKHEYANDDSSSDSKEGHGSGSTSRSRRGRGRGVTVAKKDKGPSVVVSHRGRDRGRGRGRPPKSAVAVTCMSFNVSESDEASVKCKICGLESTFREFRIHNMQKHSNIATTEDDTTIPNRSFYERKLKEMARFRKVEKFSCPTVDCKSVYKSALGLAYHLELCGKSREEIESCLVECDQCGKKFAAPNLAWHKKTRHGPPKNPEVGRTVPEVGKQYKVKRQSALKANKSIKKAAKEMKEDSSKRSSQRKKKSKKTSDDEWEQVVGGKSLEIEFEEEEEEVSRLKKGGPQKINFVAGKYSIGGKCDFNMNAVNFLDLTSERDDHWNAPERNHVDVFENISDNVWHSVDSEDMVKAYLPKKTKSVEFKTIVETPQPHSRTFEKNFRTLPYFKGEIVDEEEGNFILNAGGPILGISWHPSGKFLAISTGNDCFEDIDYKILNKRKSCVQIYSHHYQAKVKKLRDAEVKPVINLLTLQLIICLDYGYVTNLQWSSFWPKIVDSFSSESSCFSKKPSSSQSRLGLLACGCEDGSIRICFLDGKDFSLKPNFHPEKSSRIRVYKKVPEVCLKVSESVYENNGQVCRFDWHEGNRLCIAGYCSGVVAIYDLQSSSKLLRKVEAENDSTIFIVHPFWVFRAHIGPITGVHFDPASPRYFVTAARDRYLKSWDTQLRMETECKKVGLVLDTCWIRGWIHIAVSLDASILNMASQHNYVRFFQLGHAVSRPNCAEFINISGLTFHEGITVQATENGNISATYFEHFWRECDYDRNKKKSNLVNMCKVELDETSFQQINKDEFPLVDKNYAPFVFEKEEPRVILRFVKQRLRSQIPAETSAQGFENYVRFLPFLRVNKLSWCPRGGYFAVGYRNGLLSIIPATFQSLYS